MANPSDQLCDENEKINLDNPAGHELPYLGPANEILQTILADHARLEATKSSDEFSGDRVRNLLNIYSIGSNLGILSGKTRFAKEIEMRGVEMEIPVYWLKDLHKEQLERIHSSQRGGLFICDENESYGYPLLSDGEFEEDLKDESQISNQEMILRQVLSACKGKPCTKVLSSTRSAEFYTWLMRMRTQDLSLPLLSFGDVYWALDESIRGLYTRKDINSFDQIVKNLYLISGGHAGLLNLAIEEYSLIDHTEEDFTHIVKQISRNTIQRYLDEVRDRFQGENLELLNYVSKLALYPELSYSNVQDICNLKSQFEARRAIRSMQRMGIVYWDGKRRSFMLLDGLRHALNYLSLLDPNYENSDIDDKMEFGFEN